MSRSTTPTLAPQVAPAEALGPHGSVDAVGGVVGAAGGVVGSVSSRSQASHLDGPALLYRPDAHQGLSRILFETRRRLAFLVLFGLPTVPIFAVVAGLPVGRTTLGVVATVLFAVTATAVRQGWLATRARVEVGAHRLRVAGLVSRTARWDDIRRIVLRSMEPSRGTSRLEHRIVGSIRATLGVPQRDEHVYAVDRIEVGAVPVRLPAQRWMAAAVLVQMLESLERQAESNGVEVVRIS